MATDTWHGEGQALGRRVEALATAGVIPRAVADDILGGMARLIAVPSAWLRESLARNERLLAEVEGLRAEVQRGRDAAQQALDIIETIQRRHAEHVHPAAAAQALAASEN